MTISATDHDIGNYVADIVAAYVINYRIEAGAVPDLIRAVRASLQRLGDGGDPVSENKLEPAVPIKKSVFPDYIVCLEDGKKLKMLKRHLKATYDMEPDDYRAKWGPPASYPMTAPNYTEMRSAMARQSKLGHRASPKAENGAPELAARSRPRAV